MEMDWESEWENIQMEKIKEERYEKEQRRHLELLEVAERQYRVFNKKTGRFHDLNFGIDIITDEKGRPLEIEVVQNE